MANKFFIALIAFTCVIALTIGEPCPKEEPKCPTPEGEEEGSLTLLKVPDNCHNYIMCQWGLGTVKTCPANLVFNDNLKVCDHPKSTPCIQCTKEEAN